MSVVRGSSDPYGEQGETLFEVPIQYNRSTRKSFLNFYGYKTSNFPLISSFASKALH